MKLLAVAFMLGCGAVETAGGEVAEFIACPTNLIDCGQVWACSQRADNPLGRIEICVEESTSITDVEDVYGSCEPTPRHQGLCAWGCGDDFHKCNAFNGCWGC